MENNTVNVTKHAGKRIRQRLGINKKATARNAEKAFAQGITHAEVKGKLRKYLDGIFLVNFNPTNMRVYNREVYLFRDTTLITVLPLPNYLWAQADKIQKQKSTVEETDDHA